MVAGFTVGPPDHLILGTRGASYQSFVCIREILASNFSSRTESKEGIYKFDLVVVLDNNTVQNLFLDVRLLALL